MIFKIPAIALCVALIGGAAQSACNQLNSAWLHLSQTSKTIIVQDRSEINHYTSRTEAFRQAQLEAMSVAAYCSTISPKISVGKMKCDIPELQDAGFVYSLKNYSIKSNVVCATDEWLYVRSEIMILTQ